jgi:osmotically-inducible protein OsmY
MDAKQITTEVLGSKIYLYGKVRSLAEKEDAEYAVWSAPGVTYVENNLEIEEPEYVSID